MTIYRREGPPRTAPVTVRGCQHPDVWRFAVAGTVTGVGWCSRCGSGVQLADVAAARAARQRPLLPPGVTAARPAPAPRAPAEDTGDDADWLPVGLSE